MIPDFVAIGHACYDLKDGAAVAGGAVTYASRLALRFKQSVGVLSSIPDDYKFLSLFDSCSFENVPTDIATTFENLYAAGKRTQLLKAIASSIGIDNIPNDWKASKMVFIGPIADEVDKEMVNLFPDAMLCVCPQGWMRSIDENGRVQYRPLTDKSFLKSADMVILSEEDVRGDEEEIESFAREAKLLVVTRGEQGCEYYQKGRKHGLPAYQVNATDPTGAGDVFAAAFLIRYFETGDPKLSAAYANVAASFVVETKGVSGIPDREMIEHRLRKYPGL